ncbi:2-C-methyl-D-erythritol 4-phosphate cytidylyltransferase [Candidatus Woesearchaeota archaeon]|nr:2-C-methyl-D-erythritol 4-phosphate cytidylyltransferase [Candidatus Woesearchaeota archaeon]
MNYKKNKVLIEINNKPLLYYTLKAFESCNEIDSIIIVAKREDIEKIEDIKKKYSFAKIKKIVVGGKERQDSAYNGLTSIENARADDTILMHNGCNPFVEEKEIIEVINHAKNYGAAALAFPAKDTIKKSDEKNFVEKTLERNGLWQMQTPQAIKYSLAIKAFEAAKKQNFYATDDVSLVERLGKRVKLVPCSYKNIKITTEDDLDIAKGILMKDHKFNLNLRIGFGQDSHKFSDNKNKKLVLGGFKIEKERALEAESDGDVILHALFNAISQAIGMRSLGYYSTKMCLEGGIKDSKEYLKIVFEKLKEKEYKINNIGIMIEAAKPRLEPYTDKIKGSLSKILALNKENIGITYTSGDGLTSFGQGKGMQCFAVVALC